MNNLKFKKYEGLGNDFVIIDGVQDNTNLNNINFSKSQISELCNRNFGIGSDGLIVALPSSLYDYKMKYYNSDGTEGEMCGNGIRCLVKFIKDLNLPIQKDQLNIETLAGKITARIRGNDVEVNMGKPIFKPELIPTTLSCSSNNIPTGNIILENHSYKIFSAGMGNPHAVIILEDLKDVKLREWGSFIETSPSFPLSTNVHFAKVHNKKLIEILVWERGCGPTLACGTGACATLAILSLLGISDSEANIKLPGGNLFVSWPNKSGSIFMTGPANHVFTGEVSSQYIYGK